MSTSDPPTFLREVYQLILAGALFYLYRESLHGPPSRDLRIFMEKIRETVQAVKWVTKEIEILILQSLAFRQMKE
jgi:hypothetical protein